MRKHVFTALVLGCCMGAGVLVLAGCGQERPGRPKTSGKALDTLHKTLQTVRSFLADDQFDEVRSWVPGVTLYIDDGLLNDVPDIQAMRDEWRGLAADLQNDPRAEGLLARLDRLIKQIDKEDQQ